MKNNPYRKGSACYIAYESGYADAIADAIKIVEERVGMADWQKQEMLDPEKCRAEAMRFTEQGH